MGSIITRSLWGLASSDLKDLNDLKNLNDLKDVAGTQGQYRKLQP